MDDLIESTYSCVRCGEETCGGECMDSLVDLEIGSDDFNERDMFLSQTEQR